MREKRTQRGDGRVRIANTQVTRPGKACRTTFANAIKYHYDTHSACQLAKMSKEKETKGVIRMAKMIWWGYGYAEKRNLLEPMPFMKDLPPSARAFTCPKCNWHLPWSGEKRYKNKKNNHHENISIQAHGRECCPGRNLKMWAYKRTVRISEGKGRKMPQSESTLAFREQAREDRLRYYRKKMVRLGHVPVHVEGTGGGVDFKGPCYCKKCRQGFKESTERNKGISLKDPCPGIYDHSKVRGDKTKRARNTVEAKRCTGKETEN